ncbi:hypothetical protein [Streptomyces sp. NPDC088785]
MDTERPEVRDEQADPAESFWLSSPLHDDSCMWCTLTREAAGPSGAAGA